MGKMFRGFLGPPDSRNIGEDISDFVGEGHQGLFFHGGDGEFVGGSPKGGAYHRSLVLDDPEMMFLPVGGGFGKEVGEDSQNEIVLDFVLLQPGGGLFARLLGGERMEDFHDVTTGLKFLRAWEAVSTMILRAISRMKAKEGICKIMERNPPNKMVRCITIIRL